MVAAVLQRFGLDGVSGPLGRYAIPLRAVPLQFREFSSLQGAIFVAKATPRQRFGRIGMLY
jgi:hypothetical protein